VDEEMTTTNLRRVAEEKDMTYLRELARDWRVWESEEQGVYESVSVAWLV
jgi:hypothetical protein